MRHAMLRLWALLCVLALAGCGGGGAGGGDPGGGSGGIDDPATGTSMSGEELAMAMEVLALVNEERDAAGLGPLTWSDPVTEVAYDHAVDMDERNFFDHTNPDGAGPSTRLTAAGLSWSAMGENIAMGYPTAQAVMTGWMNSSGHRANILHAAFRQIGIGVHKTAESTWWVQVFRTP